MPSFVTWLDFSEAQQQKLNETLKTFEEKGTVDDLGFGSIRDAISSSFFPGTSVLQTRARYFLFIPWIYQYVENQWPKNVQGKGADFERSLISALLKSQDLEGVIGRLREKDLKTLPSSIYWSGLQTFGIFLLKGRGLQQYSKIRSRARERIEFEGEFESESGSFWSEIPSAPPDFFKFKYAELALTKKEAEWLSEHFLSASSITGKPNLLGELVRLVRERDLDFLAWKYIKKDALSDEVDENLVELIEYSSHFSSLAYGASLLYNSMLVDQLIANGREISFEYDYPNQLLKWVSKSQSNGLLQWCADIEKFWKCLEVLENKIPPNTQTFVTRLAELIVEDGLEGFASNSEIRKLIRIREMSHKKNQARFDNPSRLNAYQGEAGLIRMNFRWDLVQRIFKDIAAAYELGTN